MALLTGNTTAAARALNAKTNTNPLANASQLNLSNLGKPQVNGITNKNIVPANLSLAPIGKATAPAKQTPASNTSTSIKSTVPQASSAPPQNPEQNKAVELANLMGQLATKKEELRQQKEADKEAAKIAKEKANAPKFSGVLQDLIKRATDTSAIDKATGTLTAFRQGTSQKIADIKSDAIPLEFQQGRAQVVQQASAEKEKALEQGVENLIAARGQDIDALKSAASLAQPIQLPYGMQYVNPVTGDPIGGGSLGGLDVNSLAQQITKGQLTPSQAESMLGNNLGLVSQLNQAVLRINPSFNRIQAEAQAAARAADITQTGTTGGQVSKAATSANAALDTLQQAYNGLSTFTGASNVPFLNEIAQNVALKTGLGRQAVSAYQGALNEARAQLRSVLGSSGVNDIAAGGIVDSLLPEGMTPAEVPQKIAAAKYYIQQRVSSLTQPGVVGGGTSAGTGGIFDW